MVLKSHKRNSEVLHETIVINETAACNGLVACIASKVRSSKCNSTLCIQMFNLILGNGHFNA